MKSQFDNRLVWVEGALPGEEADVRLLRKNVDSRSWEAVATEVRRQSPRSDRCCSCVCLCVRVDVRVCARVCVRICTFMSLFFVSLC